MADQFSLVADAYAQQDAVADFYHGKTITIIAGASAGGGIDLFARQSTFPATRRRW